MVVDVDSDAGPTVLEIAAEIRREFLSRRMTEGDGQAPPGATQPGEKWAFKTEGARKSMADLDSSLAEASARAEKNRKELGSYLESLKSRTFDAEEREELLVSMPTDFDDVVDLNTQLATTRRQTRQAKAEASQAGWAVAKSSPPAPPEAEERLKLPSFLEKYFFEDKAAEQIPHLRLKREEERVLAGGAPVPEVETELQKVANQIARLDALLLKREAVAKARLQASQVSLDATKDRLQKESESAEMEKIEFLRKLKEKGLMRSASHSQVGSTRGSEPSSALQSARGSVCSEAPSALSVIVPEGPADWSGWSSTADEAAFGGPQEPATAPATPSGSGHEEEADTNTFMTATTARLGPVGPAPKPRPKRPAQSLALARLPPVAEEELREPMPGATLDETQAAEPELEEDPYAARPDGPGGPLAHRRAAAAAGAGAGLGREVHPIPPDALRRCGLGGRLEGLLEGFKGFEGLHLVDQVQQGRGLARRCLPEGLR